MSWSKVSTLIREVIILAGGLGTRLKGTVPDVPKCMAPVAGHPFLFYILQYLQHQGVERYIFSLGHKHEVVQAYLKTEYPTMDYTCVVEEQPLQTGGAIQLAIREAEDDHVLIVNGDTMFSVDLKAMAEAHRSSGAECTLALKPMRAFDRYGAVESGSDNLILSFREKEFVAQGDINGGVYILDKNSFLARNWPTVFSFESDYLTQCVAEKRFFGFRQDGYFIDIGVPEDYTRAQQECKQFLFPFSSIDARWTLFLDRDGVINENKDDSYVFNPGEFVFKKGLLEAMPFLTSVFQRIIVVTNQRGIGRGLMTIEDLDKIHAYMIEEVVQAGGKIDAVYYCTAVNDDHPDRKPNPGMGRRAMEDFPEIDFRRAVMIGDKASDMAWGRALGTKTVLISSERYKATIEESNVDLFCKSVAEFVDLMKSHGS